MSVLIHRVVNTAVQVPYDRVHARCHRLRLRLPSGDDERDARFVDEDRIGLIH
jgi:hypothetical protein